MTLRKGILLSDIDECDFFFCEQVLFYLGRFGRRRGGALKGGSRLGFKTYLLGG